MFTKAVKYESSLKMSLSGPPGSGKTWTSLTLATALADGRGVALIDTEHGSASLYADHFSFDTLELDSYHPQRFIDAVAEAEQADYAVLIIDSLSHAWNGKGGLLEIVDMIAARKYKGNTFNAWKDAGLIQNALVEAILTANLHIIVTLRSKMDHVQEKNEQTGKTEIRKLGMAPIQRDGVEYELDVIADLDVLNTMVIQKSRYPKLSGLVIPKPDGRLVATIRQGLAGVPRPQVQAITAPPSIPPAAANIPVSTPAPSQPSALPVETPALPQATPGQSTAQEMITEQQRTSIEKICTALGQPTPIDYEKQTYLQAKETIGRLTALYRQAQQAKREKKAS